MPDHSPLPWRINDAGLILASDGFCIQPYCDDDRMTADAAFIVRAVNSHAELVKIVAGVLEEELSYYRHAEPNVTTRRIEELEAILAKAKGE